MSLPPPMPSPRVQNDLEHLKLLAIFHYVNAGLSLLGVIGTGAVYSVMKTALSDPKIWAGQRDAPPPEMIQSVVSIIILVIVVWSVASALLNLLSGLAIHSRKSRALSLVTAALNCLQIPLGTALGIFTFIVLSRESVRALYAQNQVFRP